MIGYTKGSSLVNDSLFIFSFFELAFNLPVRKL
jgi:hypothetical protein